MMHKKQYISVVVPLYNEADSVQKLHADIMSALKSHASAYEVVYVDDGSCDDTASVVEVLVNADSSVKLVKLSRNFGKENALTAGLSQVSSQSAAVITLDGDGQHPPELIPKFITQWQHGADIVVGHRIATEGASMFKRFTSNFFYRAFNLVASHKLVPGATDFCLLDKRVLEELLKLGEANRITRGLVDWLGFSVCYIDFTAKKRTAGSEQYSLRKLIQLGMNSFVSLSPAPLYIFGYIGLVITSLASILGGAVFIEQLVLEDPLGWNFTGTAMLGILIVFLVGLLLVSQGILSLYVSHIHAESKKRPLYIIDYKKSRGISR